MIYTIFPSEEWEMPQDFASYSEAVEYANNKGLEDYTIESTTGEVV